MSVQFGRWHFEGKPAPRDYLEGVSRVLTRYGIDGKRSYAKNGLDILYFAFHTTSESRQEIQPHVLKSGSLLTWDGRLDNRVELIDLLREGISQEAPDVSIVAAVYERWGTESFSRLIGDWALSVWNPTDRSLIMAKDPIGARHLFYSATDKEVTWCSVLEPLIQFAGRALEINEEYIAGWFSLFPDTRLSPYQGILSVPASSFVLLEPGNKSVTKYWDLHPDKKITYHTDSEYEEHFRLVLVQSVRRRLRTNAPVLAELSGGIDSSSIVCVADTVRDSEPDKPAPMATVSYYDDSDPNWNERPYFTKVEEKRKRVGCHIKTDLENLFRCEVEAARFTATPGSCSAPTKSAAAYANCIRSQGIRVVLSGIGGDELLGGVPTPTPELMDLLASARLVTLAHQLKYWALSKRRPWFRLFAEAVREFLPPTLVGIPEHVRPAPWLDPGFVKRNRRALTGFQSRIRLFGARPSFQQFASTLDALRRQLACSPLPCEPCYEKRYPYLDRDLIEFVSAIPREQLVRPGQRRSLMRRSLNGIVPGEVLHRKRKAFLATSPTRAIAAQESELDELSRNMISAAFGIVNADVFRTALRSASRDGVVPIVTLTRTLGIEHWLRGVKTKGFVCARG